MDYILWHRSHRFTIYALPLTGILQPAFAVGLRLQTASPLISSLIIHSLLGSFTMDSIPNSFALNTLSGCSLYLMYCLEQFYPRTLRTHLVLFHLFATQALCQFTARPLQPMT